MNKRLIALLLAFALCLGLTAGAAAEERAVSFASAAAMEESLAAEQEDADAASETDGSANASTPQGETADASSVDPADIGDRAAAPAEQSAQTEELRAAAESVQYFRDKTIYLPVGDCVSLLAEGAAIPENAAFSSGGTAVTVSEAGEATGAAAGSVTVVLKSAEGKTLESVRVICYEKGSYFSQDAFYVGVGKSLTLKAARSLPEGTKWSAGTPSHVSVSSAGKLTGKAVGRSTIALKLPDGTVLDTAEAYAFEPTSYTVTPKKAKSGVAHARTLTTKNKNKNRTYYLFKQQFDLENHRYLYSNGCSVTAMADILTGYGFTDVTPAWLQETYIPKVAAELGIDVGTHLDNDGDRKALGFYGLQQTMLAMGVSCEIKSAYGDIEGAAETITTALSEGRPVILLVNKSEKVNGNPSICSGWHYLYLSGIDENGYVLNTCGTSANVQTNNTLNGQTVKLTVTDLLTHYRKSSKRARKTDSDFFISTGATGTLTYLECLSPNPGLAENAISARNKTLTVSSDAQTFSLNASVLDDAKLHYASDSKKVAVNSKGQVTVAKNYAGKATITITADQTRLYQAAEKEVTVRVNLAKNTISGGNRKLTASSRVQTVSLGCSARGKAALRYQSDHSSVKVSDRGVVTVPKGFVGTVKITVSSAKTSFYSAASKTLAVTVSPGGTTISSCVNKSGKKLRAVWKRNASISGYQLQYSTSSSFKNAKHVTIKGKGTTSRTLSGLKKKKTYYVRVRTWKTVDGVPYYSAWSGAKKVRINK